MKSCKKLLLALLILLSGILALSFSQITVKAEGEEKVKTEPFLPSTYFEYYKLNSPEDICYDQENVYIAETSAIVIYNYATQSYTRYNCAEMTSTGTAWSSHGNSKIDCYKGYIFILNNSELFYISPEDRNTLIHADQITISTHFSIQDDRLFVNKRNSIEIWNINYNNNFLSLELSDWDCSTEFSTLSFAYSPNSNSIYSFENNQCINIKMDTSKNPVFQNFSPDYTHFYNGKIYFIANNKLYEYEENLSLSNNSSPKEILNFNALGRLKGFCLKDDKALLTDNDNNEILEFDLNTISFTGNYVATYKATNNRLTADVVDTVISDGYIYTLQKDSLLRFKTDQSSYEKVVFPSTFSLSEFNPQHVSVINQTVLLSNGKSLKSFTLVKSEQALSAQEIQVTTSGTWEENNICGLYAFDGEFYLLKNRTINNVQHALIYKLLKSSNGYEVNSEAYLSFIDEEGTGKSFTINSFGELYLITENNIYGKRVLCYDLINQTKSESTTPLDESVTKIISDFENVYVLKQNEIINVTKDTSYDIEKSSNYDALDTPISFTADLDKGITYLLYKGYILQTNELPLKTPNTYAIPNGYNSYVDSPKVATLSSGAKLFLVEDNDSGYFKCEHITSATNSEYLMITDLSEDFCLVALDEYTYIARKQDLNEKELTTFTPEFTQGYFVTNAGRYAQPLLNLSYKQTDVNAYSLVTVIGGITVNSTNFYKVKLSDDSIGYIEKSFIVEQILETIDKENYYLAKCKATKVYSADGAELGTIQKGTVKIYGKENGLYKISYGDGIGYVKASAIVQKKNKAVRNSLVLMLVATSFTITAIYLQIRHNRKFEL